MLADNKKYLQVLLVEDDRNDQKLILSTINRLPSFSVSTTIVDSLEWATKWLQKADFNLVILDLGLPDSKGLRTIESIRSVSPQINILIFTGATMESQLLLDNNIKGFFPKSKLAQENAEIELDTQIKISTELESISKHRNSLRIITQNLEQEIAKCQQIQKIE